LGGSSIALFGRVGGGIYTKAADVGADLVDKVVHGIPEDSPKNPAVIADLVGDNVGDIAGMGSDLFGSFAESTCAALVIASQNEDLTAHGWGAVCFPVVIAAAGIFVCFITSFVVTHIKPVMKESDIELTLRLQLIVSTALMIPVAYVCTSAFLPDEFHISGVSRERLVHNSDAFICVFCGTVGGLVTGLFTEYYTSKDFAPVQELAKSCITGASTNIIYGLALGYLSVVAPVFGLSFIVYVAFSIADVYGVALAAVGMLSTLATVLTIDGFGPIADNAGGVSEMAELPAEVRERTDALDAAGNTTAAIGKGFAIGSAALVSLALFGAFTTRIQAKGAVHPAEILEPMTFAFMLVGASLPYWFSAMTMKSVAQAAMQMIVEVERQFTANPDLLNPNSKALPDYARCVKISTEASLQEMIAPGALVILSPLVIGTFFGVYAVYGTLTGALLSGVQLATSMSNTGGAWDNAKKYIGASEKTSIFGGKGSEAYKAAVVGDTVGDPMKDTSGPALNILMKLMAIISLVFAEYFWAINDGNGVFNLPPN
jgi:inorganic pyrophosphatase